MLELPSGSLLNLRDPQNPLDPQVVFPSFCIIMSLKMASLVVLLFVPAVFADSEVANAAARRLECKVTADTTKETQAAMMDMASAGTDCSKLTAANDKMKKAVEDAGCKDDDAFKDAFKTLDDALESNGCDASGASPRANFLMGLASLPLLAVFYFCIGF